MSKKQVTSGTKAKKTIVNIIIHIFLAILSFIWVLPIFWVVLTSFRGEKGSYVTTFFPKTYTINNYVKLFTDTSILNFPKMFVNTFIIAIFTCIISTIFVLSVSYTMSRMRFNMRKPFMNVAMILGLFPSFMSMIAVYYILKALGLAEGSMIRIALIVVFSAGSGVGFYVAKGFFDTIPKALDEAAIIDGATRWQVFTKITAPLSKPIIVYTILTSFMGPWVDFIFAKANLAKSYNGVAPEFNTEGHINIRKGRHPLLDAKNVVPIDVRLGEEYKQLIITGPNTGGKTVSLKTVGLLTLMGQAGLHIPAADRSKLAIFEDVFADIGDEQSIEQSLSTFSSHMTNIVKILEKADDRSLCLFDELCSGTDPTEGAALAISILNRLHQYGAITMATTHYSELKVYALSTDGVENACCEFNVETLSPTYRLLIGIPGKSNAFAISSKLGLDENIIEDAKSRINDNDLDFEDLIASLESQRQTIEKEQLEINSYKAEIEKLKKQLEEKNERIDKSKDKILREANEEAYKILQDAKELADKTIRNFNKYGQGQAPMSQMEKERSALRDKMNDKEKKLSDIKKNTAKANHKAPKKLRIGDSVLVLSLNLKGTVHTLPNAKGDLYVQMGILRSLVNINDLVLLNDDVSPAKKYGGSGSKIKMSKSLSVSSEINLIGKTTDEALALLDKYLDDAYIAHLTSVRIVHGKGTGALRKAVHGLLKRTKTIAEYHLGEFGEGDAGVTIATFK